MQLFSGGGDVIKKAKGEKGKRGRERGARGANENSKKDQWEVAGLRQKYSVGLEDAHHHAPHALSYPLSHRFFEYAHIYRFRVEHTYIRGIVTRVSLHKHSDVGNDVSRLCDVMLFR